MRDSVENKFVDICHQKDVWQNSVGILQASNILQIIDDEVIINI